MSEPLGDLSRFLSMLAEFRPGADLSEDDAPFFSHNEPGLAFGFTGYRLVDDALRLTVLDGQKYFRGWYTRNLLADARAAQVVRSEVQHAFDLLGDIPPLATT